MKRVLIAGAGSPHGNDTFGWQVIDHLKKQLALRNHPELILEKLRTPLDLLNYIDNNTVLSNADPRSLILVDACVGLAQGKVYRWKWPNVPSDFSTSHSTHSLGLVETLNLAQTLGTIPDETWVYAAELDHNIAQMNLLVERCGQELSQHIHKLLA